ncbi:MAG: acyl-CoA thioesterase [Gemmatimonadaceae bacterium]|nr:acyl-CoA thioesterase [Gemmatimonadaceae bacterium]
MNLWLRLLWLWLVGRFRAPVPALGPCRTPFRVSLFDLDVFRHMNNGRYFTIMDLARLDMMRRSGLLDKLHGAGFFPVVTAESLFFRKSLNWRQPFEIDSEVVAWDERSIVMAQRFFVGSEEVAGGLVRARFLRRSGGSVPTAEIVALAGDDILHPPRPDWLEAWLALFDAGLPGAARARTTLLVFTLLLVGCRSLQRTPGVAMAADRRATETAIEQISAARARSNAAIAAHDTTAIVREWMPDLHVVASTGSQTAGAHANVSAMAAQFARRPDTKWVRSPASIRVFDAWAVASEEGNWVGTWTDPDGPVRIGGTYLAQWRLSEGRWRIQAELFVPLTCEGGAYCRRRP